jgi:hypothetical protein
MWADCESCELLRAVARSSDAEQIHRLAAKVDDWDSLLELAEEHRVVPMLFLRLSDMRTSVPPFAQARLRAEFDRNMFHSLANAAELIAVLKALEDEMIPAMPFKGVVLGASIYHDLTTRPAGDLDVLIHYKDLLRATIVLIERGYELKTPVRADGTPAQLDDYEYHFERQADGMVMELRWRFQLSRFKHNLGMDWVWPHRRTTILAGAEVSDMGPEITLLMLCMHGSNHAWRRLIWICDVAQLLASSPGLDWREVTHQAEKSGLCRALAIGVLLAHRFAGATVPRTVLRRFDADTTAYNMAQHIHENLFEAPGSKPMGRIPYGLQLLDFHDWVRLLLSTDFLRPK